MRSPRNLRVVAVNRVFQRKGAKVSQRPQKAGYRYLTDFHFKNGSLDIKSVTAFSAKPSRRCGELCCSRRRAQMAGFEIFRVCGL
jgi:hypothetical protein